MSPWFPKINNETDNQQKSRIYSDSQLFVNDCLYALHKDFISINPIWISYLKSNIKILKDYCYWNLVLFLQTRNPNVPDIPNKLIKPAIRNGLTKQTNEYWKLVFKELGSVNCILQEKFNPDGFNVGINVNEDAGQTISHCHIHIIPRYKGDVENP